ncbi:hypothetical protein ACWDR2_29195 [Streptomyces sp. NPDC003631]
MIVWLFCEVAETGTQGAAVYMKGRPVCRVLRRSAHRVSRRRTPIGSGFSSLFSEFFATSDSAPVVRYADADLPKSGTELGEWTRSSEL